MSLIKINELKKTYVTYKRGSNFKEVMKSLFVRENIEMAALKGVSFDITKGEILGFLGPNGAGKSTTLKILTGVLYPTSGSVNIMGYIPWRDRKKYVANIGAVFGQKSQLIWDIPPMDSFIMNRAIYGIDHKSFSQRLNQMVDILNVAEIINKPTRQLSLGERMKCEFIMAMLHNPKIVFLDEPTIGLDIVAKDKIREFILEMNKNGTTFILTTHDLSDVERLAQRVMVINYGEIVFDNSLEELRKVLGARKIVKISARNIIPDFSNSRGIKIINKLSKFDIGLELDTKLMPLNKFIEKINSDCNIKDITIEEPSIEEIIKELYST